MNQSFKHILRTIVLSILISVMAVPASALAAETGIVILAAGLGSRMKSDSPKALQPIDGKPMIFYVLNAIKAVSEDIPVALVVGYKKELVQSYISEQPNFKRMNISFVEQPQQLGTGHAARCAMDSGWGERRIANGDEVLVLPGDMPLLTPEMISRMISPLPKGAPMKLMTTVLENPFGYGRIVRSLLGSVQRIVEEKDASADQKRISEVGVSIYTFNAEFLRNGLHGINTENAQGEYYLTDLVELAAKQGEVPVIKWGNPDDLQGVNTVEQLQTAARLMLKRLDVTRMF